jgi:hypothetical protein
MVNSAKQSRSCGKELGCFVAIAPRNDETDSTKNQRRA